MLHIFLFLCRGMKKWRVHGPKPSIDTGVQVKTLVTSTVCLKSIAVAWVRTLLKGLPLTILQKFLRCVL